MGSSSVPPGLLPGTWGCCHGSGLPGLVIRDAELRMTRSQTYPQGNRQAAWAGHCVVFAGSRDFGHGSEPAIIQAQWPKVVLSPASVHHDTCWASRQPLTAYERDAGLRAALDLVNEPYDWGSYLWFAAKLLQVSVSGNLAHLFGDPKMSAICSGVVVRELEAMGVPLDGLETAAISDPDFVSPADLLAWGLSKGWMSTAPPANWR